MYSSNAANRLITNITRSISSIDHPISNSKNLDEFIRRSQFTKARVILKFHDNLLSRKHGATFENRSAARTVSGGNLQGVPFISGRGCQTLKASSSKRAIRSRTADACRGSLSSLGFPPLFFPLLFLFPRVPPRFPRLHGRVGGNWRRRIATFDFSRFPEALTDRSAHEWRRPST